MPQPKSRPARSRKDDAQAGAPPGDDESVARGITALRALLARAVMLPTERLRETLDDAVRRGRMTRADAEDLAQSLITLGRRQTEDLMADVEQLLGRPRAAAADARRRTDRVLRACAAARAPATTAAAGTSTAAPTTGRWRARSASRRRTCAARTAATSCSTCSARAVSCASG